MSEQVRQDFGSTTMVKSTEQNQSALAAQATARVNARFVMALQRPRSWDDVRVRLLAECRRPGFAEVARYRKPVGKGYIEGPSARFAEACVRAAGNLDVDIIVVSDDTTKRTLVVTALDFECNASFSATVSVDKTVERQDPKDRAIISRRENSAGNPVFCVAATEDELLTKQNAQVSKAARTLILRLIPQDVVDECMEACVVTVRNRAATDPAGERKKLCDAFAAKGVQPSQLETYLGHGLAAMQPAELAELREVYAAIRDGETTWTAVMEAKTGEPQGATPAKAPGLADRIRSKAKPKVAADADGVVAEQEATSQPPSAREPGED